MFVFFNILSLISLTVPFLIGHFFLHWDFLGVDFPLGIGLLLQFVIGIPILFYQHGIERDKRTVISVGYFLLFAGLSGSFLAGKTLWLPIFWELSSVGSLLVYLGQGLNKAAVRSYASLMTASGVSSILLAGWAILPEGSIGLFFLIFALLIKSAYSVFHIWYPEFHAGSPPHLSAAYSGIAINVPLLLFMKFVFPAWHVPIFLKILVVVSGLGVFIGGITAFFSKDIKVTFAYSTIEKANFLWLCIFLASIWINDANEDIAKIGKYFLILFYLTMIHHSVSKAFQFLSFGSVTRLSGTNNIDASRGYGRLTGISLLLLGLGTFSFAVLPGTPGFISESTYLFVISKIIEMPANSGKVLLPSLIFIMIGIILGGNAHIRIYLTTVFSMPEKRAEMVPLGEREKKYIQLSLYILGGLLFLIPVLFYGVFHYYWMGLGNLFNEFSSEWYDKIFWVSILCVVFYATIISFRWAHRIEKRRLWDCGNQYRGTELSIRSSVVSEPLFNSIGKLINSEDGTSNFDKWIFQGIEKFLNLGRFWAGKTESGEVANYIGFSALAMLLSLAFLFLLKFYKELLWIFSIQ